MSVHILSWQSQPTISYVTMYWFSWLVPFQKPEKIKWSIRRSKSSIHSLHESIALIEVQMKRRLFHSNTGLVVRVDYNFAQKTDIRSNEVHLLMFAPIHRTLQEWRRCTSTSIALAWTKNDQTGTKANHWIQIACVSRDSRNHRKGTISCSRVRLLTRS